MNLNKIKTGVMVKASYQGGAIDYVGIVTDIRETQDIFSEKYAIIETETVIDVLVEGSIRTFILEEDTVEVIIE